MKVLRGLQHMLPITAWLRFLSLRILIGLSVGVALIVGGYTYYKREVARPPDPPGVITFFQPQQSPSFSLVDQNGHAFTQARLRGKWTIMFFGYTHCPDFCPATLTGLNSAFIRLERQEPELAESSQVVFVSVDPFRDTRAVLKDFVSNFNKGFIGVTGLPQQLHRLTDTLGARYDYADPVSDIPLHNTMQRPQHEYVVDHGSGLYIFDDQAALVAWVLPPHTAQRIAYEYKYIRKLYE